VFAWIDAEKGRVPHREAVSLSAGLDQRLLRRAGSPGVPLSNIATDRRLPVLVRASFDESRQRYGSPRIHEDLIGQEERVSRKRIIRLMQEDGLEARARKRFKCTQ